MFSRKVLLITFICWLAAPQSHTAQISEYFSDIEPLLKSGKYEEADQKFDALDKSVKVARLNTFMVWSTYHDTVKWLKAMDSMDRILTKANNRPSSIGHSDYGRLYEDVCDVKPCLYMDQETVYKERPSAYRSMPFSSGFVQYLNSRTEAIYNGFKPAYQKVLAFWEQEAERAHQRALKEKQERELKRQAEVNERKARLAEISRREAEKEEATKRAQKAEVEKLNTAARARGYSGYTGENLMSMMYDTQQHGGLENYLNQVIGCHRLATDMCERWYPKATITQVLDDALLYGFGEIAGSEYLGFTVLIMREPGKLYQEGQSLQQDFLVFTGTLTYETVLGSMKTVPVFKPISLSY